jgi:hypothetical protein
MVVVHMFPITNIEGKGLAAACTCPCTVCADGCCCLLLRAAAACCTHPGSRNAERAMTPKGQSRIQAVSCAHQLQHSASGWKVAQHMCTPVQWWL